MNGTGHRVVLAYSGGVDTTACIPYLRHEMGCDYIVAMAVDLGQGDELEPIRRKALLAGADEAIVLDVKERFVDEYGFAALAANAVHDLHYPLASALGRPLIAELLVETARRYRCDAVAHGATGKGNDQVRMDLGVALRDRDLIVLAPAREWGFTRAQTIAYSESFGIPPHVAPDRPWAIDLNVLGRNIEAGPIEDLEWEPSEDVWALTTAPADAPDEADYVEVSFENGRPVALDGLVLDPLSLVEALNARAGAHGIGRIDMLENRVVGVLSRELYEAPALTVLLRAHLELEMLVLPPDVLHHKRALDTAYGKLVYDGLWHGPLRSALDAFVAFTQRYVHGTIRLRLFKGSATVVGREARAPLYRRDLVTYGEGSNFDQGSATGFIDLFGLPGRTWAKVHGV
ncbi:argininosuccinate synthase [Rathayibacter sp. VKM Ac-2803]|uniref:argininosuccinate synthase n=1 Tax=Rathayibacter sp. VKM Ac-2803 TaxID=2609256 RepID=UPI00135B557D|nr:argininosuccinate synthase [Rathayibacter sp. VKM Ac-2803]MWV49882.1 argininosuccinate synthase [Rathayibacter sp. VKM Ac-2803]